MNELMRIFEAAQNQGIKTERTNEENIKKITA